MRAAPTTALALLCLAVVACHRRNENDEPMSCLVEHDGGVTQCFDEIGPTARAAGKTVCDHMFGTHTFQEGAACPIEGVVASCRKQAGTESERIERCYRDEPACKARCAKSGGELF